MANLGTSSLQVYYIRETKYSHFYTKHKVLDVLIHPHFPLFIFFAEHSTLKLSHLQECSIIYFFLGTFRVCSLKRWQDERIALMGKLISCWSEAAKALQSPRVLLRTACQEFHSPQSIWRPFRDQTLSWPEPSWATQLIRSSPLLFNFPSLSLSLTPTLLCLLPNYNPLMRTSVGRKLNWEVFLSQNKYFPELHNPNQHGSITLACCPPRKHLLFLLYCHFLWQKHRADRFIVLRVSCAKMTDNWRDKPWCFDNVTIFTVNFTIFISLQRNVFPLC